MRTASYRSRMTRFPVPAAAGNSDLGVWDDADRLIEFNLELRRGNARRRREALGCLVAAAIVVALVALVRWLVRR